MATYKAPVEDVQFILNDVLGYERYSNLAGFSDASPDMVAAILGEAAKFCEEVVQPLNQPGDRQGCTRHDDGSVTTPDGFKEAYQAYSDAGWIGLACDPDYGGQGLPYTLAAIINEFVSASNMAWGMYSGLTQGAIAALQVHASDEQKQTYLPKMISGKWSGTMNLTEPHCGTDLGLIKTQGAAATDDGSATGMYRPEDLHLSGRARPDREHRAPGPGPYRRRAGRHARGISLCSSCRSIIPDAVTASPAIAIRCQLRFNRGKDGHPRQCHVCHEL